jgi:hypothetical protein
MELAMEYITTPAWAERSWQQSNEGRAHYIKMARAVIRAMRTPTTEMLRDALIGMPVRTEPAAAIWEAMIDAASPQED